MTAPQIDPAAFAAFIAQQQAQAAPPAPQQFAPQMPQGFPQVPQQYAPQGFPMQPPAPQLAAGSLDDFFGQPSTGGGPALKFAGPGVTQVGIVSRAITNADIQQQTQPGTNMPQTYRDGRPKFVMKVPLNVQPSAEHPEGVAQWYVAGSARDELVRAMGEAGAPAGPPEAGAGIAITCTGTRPSGPGMNPAKTWSIKYTRPNGAAPAAPAAPVEIPVQAAPVAPPVAPVAPPAASAPAGMSPEQAALLAKLTGAQG